MVIDWGEVGVFSAVSLAVIVVAILVIWLLLRLNKFTFQKIQENHKGLHLLFYRRICAAVIVIGGVIVVFSLFGGVDSVWKTLLGGTAIIESIFNWPGVGNLSVAAINARDYPVVQGYALLMAIVYLVVNWLVDLSYRFIDPRVGKGGD